MKRLLLILFLAIPLNSEIRDSILIGKDVLGVNPKDWVIRIAKGGTLYVHIGHAIPSDLIGSSEDIVVNKVIQVK